MSNAAESPPAAALVDVLTAPEATLVDLVLGLPGAASRVLGMHGLLELGRLTPYAVAAALHVPRTRIERIAREEKPVTADTALRLGKFFKTGAAFWMNIQTRFDLETAEDVLAPQIKKIAAYEAA